MHTRKFFKAINQAKEVVLAKPGYRRDQTWTALSHTLRLLPTDQLSTLSDTLSLPASHDAAQEVIYVLTKILDHSKR